MGATGDTNDRPSMPRSIRHKRILDVAAERPDASFEAIAEEIPSVSADTVEHVLDQYGDPAEESPEVLGDPIEQSPEQIEKEDEETRPEWSALTDKQQETLRAIRDNPTATQQELGDIVGVSGATICCRVNGIDGFDWSEREDFAAEIMETSQANSTEERNDPVAANGAKQQLEKLTDRVAALEDKLDGPGDDRIDDPELAHKILHACLESDAISEDEELQILRTFLR